MRLFFLFDFPKRIRKLMGSQEAEGGTNFGGLDAMRRHGLLMRALLNGMWRQAFHKARKETGSSPSRNAKACRFVLPIGALPHVNPKRREDVL